MKTFKILSSILLVTFLIYNYFFLRIPVTAPAHHYDAILIFLTLILFLILSLVFRKKIFLSHKKIFIFIYFLCIGINLSLVLWKEGHFITAQQRVLNASTQELQTWGRHFIIGYRDFNELKALVSRGAIGGVYITQRNIQGKSYVQIKSELAELQAIQKSLKLPPLWIAADQEGGLVSRLTPPLPYQVGLGSLIKSYPELAERNKAVQRYAAQQAKGLATLGVNLNFSPVVDLKFKTPQLRLLNSSQIYKRAISEDPHTVSEVAQVYAATLYQNGVMPTLKHFPGLGRVAEDTHVEEAGLSLDLASLEKADWLPFFEVAEKTPAMLMLSHVKLNALDTENPSSVSTKLVAGVLRQKWNPDLILITDDFSMHPIFSRQGGVRQASLDALNAGVDLVLISYDPQLYYDAMDAVLQAARQNKLSYKNHLETLARFEKVFSDQNSNQSRSVRN